MGQCPTSQIPLPTRIQLLTRLHIATSQARGNEHFVTGINWLFRPMLTVSYG